MPLSDAIPRVGLPLLSRHRLLLPSLMAASSPPA